MEKQKNQALKPGHTAELSSLPIVIYTCEDGTTQLDVKLDGESVWLSQQQLSLIFQTDRTSILRHINNIYKTGELEENSTCAKIAQVRIEGKRKVIREIPFYNLDMIISVGYRVNSKTATSFRKWATSILQQYLIKGYSGCTDLDDSRIKDRRERYDCKAGCKSYQPKQYLI